MSLGWIYLALAAAIGWPSPLGADGPWLPRRDLNRATTSRAAREDAIRSIPLDQLDEKARTKVDAVLSDVSFFRRLPVRVIPCDPEMYLFLVEHPDVVVNIWQVLGLSRLRVEQIGPGRFHVVDPGGMSGTMQYLYATHDTHVIYAEGRYRGPMLARAVDGRAVVILKTGYVREPDGRYWITCRLDAFVQVDRNVVELLAKTFQPLVGRVADMNFSQAAGFLGSVSKTAELNLAGVERLAERLSNVQPEVRRQFAEMAGRVAEKAVAAPDAATAPRIAEQTSKQSAR